MIPTPSERTKEQVRLAASARDAEDLALFLILSAAALVATGAWAIWVEGDARGGWGLLAGIILVLLSRVADWWAMRQSIRACYPDPRI